MSRTTKQKHAISQACRDYPDTGSEKIVLNLLRQDSLAKTWLDKRIAAGGAWDAVERHHIYGRGTGQKNFRCNIIGLYKAVHEYCHQVCKKRVELCCLYAQWKLNEKHLENVALGIEKELPANQWFWNLDALDAICGRASLEGRIDVDLRDNVRGTPLQEIAEDLLCEVMRAKVKLPF